MDEYPSFGGRTCGEPSSRILTRDRLVILSFKNELHRLINTLGSLAGRQNK